MIYEIKHNDIDLARVEIDDSYTARAAIKEMVEFLGMWETALAKDGGDYTQCWLRQLGHHLLFNGEAPKDEEGWHALDGSKGIRLLNFWPWEFDPEQTTIAAE